MNGHLDVCLPNSSTAISPQCKDMPALQRDYDDRCRMAGDVGGLVWIVECFTQALPAATNMGCELVRLFVLNVDVIHLP
jgi:hypothetical protein